MLQKIRYFNAFVFIRCYSKGLSLKPFTSPNWLVHQSNFETLPIIERKYPDKIELIFTDKSTNVYMKNERFKLSLNRSLKRIHSNHIYGYTDLEIKAKISTWKRLREQLYLQLKDSELNMKLANYHLTISETLQPTDPTTIILQLLSINHLNNLEWQSILSKNEVTEDDKIYHIILNHFNLIYDQEILPQSVPSTIFNKSDLDISNPSEWFPEARKLKRTIITHLGPTNSGKTYNALQKLKTSSRGYYAGPLRLLAREIYERFKMEGIRCNLLTGEEVIDDLDNMGNKAGLTSGTIEMIPLNQEFDMVVLDEIQMMGDESRGWAWTNALLGLRAREIHICGEKSVLPLLQKLVRITGDKLVVNEYQRLGKLEVENEPLKNGLKGLRKGDCVISFSKRRIMDLKLKIEKLTNFKVAVIYGSLPPETRVKQASMFNTGECEILVASDAVGMGLNLSIKRIIFSASEKWNGTEVTQLTPSNIKQIGGRAGRYKVSGTCDDTSESIGYVTAMFRDVLLDVRRGIDAPITYLHSAVIWPTDELITKLISHCSPGTKFSTLLEALARDVETKTQKLFALCDLTKRIDVIRDFENIQGLTLNDKIRLSYAPVQDTPMMKRAFLNFCDTIAKRQSKSILDYSLPLNVLNEKYIYDENVTLEFYEEIHHIIMLYFWLNIRYPSYFIDSESAYDLKNHCEWIIFHKIELLRQNPYIKDDRNMKGHQFKFTKRPRALRYSKNWKKHI